MSCSLLGFLKVLGGGDAAYVFCLAKNCSCWCFLEPKQVHSSFSKEIKSFKLLILYIMGCIVNNLLRALTGIQSATGGNEEERIYKGRGNEEGWEYWGLEDCSKCL